MRPPWRTELEVLACRAARIWSPLERYVKFLEEMGEAMEAGREYQLAMAAKAKNPDGWSAQEEELRAIHALVTELVDVIVCASVLLEQFATSFDVGVVAWKQLDRFARAIRLRENELEAEAAKEEGGV